MKVKEIFVIGFIKGVEFLFKKNGVEYIKGIGSFQDEYIVKVEFNDGGEISVIGKNIFIVIGFEVIFFFGFMIDEQIVISSIGVIVFEKVFEKFVVIGGGIIGLEMVFVWFCLGFKVIVVEYFDQIGGFGMDIEVVKGIQKILKKQGIIFKIGIKVFFGEKIGDEVKVQIEVVKGGKEEMVCFDCDFEVDQVGMLILIIV